MLLPKANKYLLKCGQSAIAVNKRNYSTKERHINDMVRPIFIEQKQSWVPFN